MKTIFPKFSIGDYEEKRIKLGISPVEVFMRLYPHFETVFLLESLGEDGKYNRYSYIGFEPLFTVSALGNELIVNSKKHTIHNPYDLLKSLCTGQDAQKGFCGGLVGYISHEGTKYFEPAFVGYTNKLFPDFEFGFYLDGLKYDKETQRLIYFHHGNSRLAQVQSILNEKETIGDFDFEKKGVSHTETEYRKMLETAHEHLRAGDVFQVVLSLKTYYKMTGDLRKVYSVLREVNPSPNMYFFKFGKRQIISASPELLIQVKGKQLEHFGTLAGTIRRGKDKKEDQKLADQLVADEKERAEHMMLVDLARNDVGKICEFGSVYVDKLLTVKKYSHVQHIYSEVRGILKKPENSFSALAACFPAGTLTGAPKIEAIKIIYQLEKESRGPYGGVGGYFSLSGDSMFAIAIRSLFVCGNEAFTQTGSGIVIDSTFQKEYQEIKNKQAAMEMTLIKAKGAFVETTATRERLI